MKLGRPRTLLGLVLFGLAVVTLPLLIAVGHAVMKLEQLADEAELVVSRSQTATLENQRLASQLNDMERNARQYLQVVQNDELLTLYTDAQNGFQKSLAVLRTLPQDESITAHLEQLAEDVKSVEALVWAGPAEGATEQVVDLFRRMNASAREVSQGMRLILNEELNELQANTRAAQQTLAWQSAALLPGTVVLVLFFLVLVGRPMRQVDRAIRNLGEGDFSQPIRVSGPRDIETLGLKLEWLRERLRESTEEKNKFLRHMSHELKTPLANIREGTELLLDGSVGPLDHQQQEVTGILRENGIKLQKLIENLLTFSAWQTKTGSLELTEFELKPMVFGVVSQHRLAISNKKIKLKLNVSPIRVRADEGKLKLVLDNLVSNAIKFTPDGGTIQIDAGMQGQELVIDVADSGPGVHPDDGDRIFEAFYQGRRPQGGPVGGTGIGLSVVSECVQAHGGTVELLRGDDIKTRQPRAAALPGAHFQVRLPLRRAADKPALQVVNG
ncbi:MAG TPA: ATP-binding protein [Gammaproteobacteria bacterium]